MIDELKNTFIPSAQTEQHAFTFAHYLKRMYRFHATGTGQRSPLWVYDDKTGIWKDTGDDIVRSLVGPAMGSHFKSHAVNETLSLLKSLVLHPEVDIFEGGPDDRVVCKNGVLDLNTGFLNETFEPNEYHITGIPVVYDPEATCPNFTRFLDQILDDEDDKKAIIEWFGYCLYKKYIFEIILFLVGRGANGKSILMFVLECFLGKENISSVEPQDLNQDRFAAVNLWRKLANLAGDIDSAPIKRAGLLKKVTGGDFISAQHKFRDSFRFLNYAKMMYTCNKVPESWDTSNAWYRRIHIIHFRKTFERKDKNYIPRDRLIESLTTPEELSGILNLARAGWQRLYKNNDLSGATPTKDKESAYLKESDPAHYFLKTFIIQDTTAPQIPSNDLYDIYIQYCRANDKIPIDPSFFGRKVKRFVPFTEKKQTSTGGRVYTGIVIDYEKVDFECAPQQGVLE